MLAIVLAIVLRDGYLSLSRLGADLPAQDGGRVSMVRDVLQMSGSIMRIWLDAAASRLDVDRMRMLAGLMAVGGLERLATRATLGRPHRFHDLLLAVELTAPLVVVKALARRERPDR